MIARFDPRGHDNLDTAVAHALKQAPVQMLDRVTPFTGVGVYALYYIGDHAAYEPLAHTNVNHPGRWAIFVGRTEPHASCNDFVKRLRSKESLSLYEVMDTHRGFITMSENLAVRDFHVRVLTMEETWVSLAHAVAVRINIPVWNELIDGMASSDHDSHETSKMTSRWDTLHPGRPLPSHCQARLESSADLEQEAAFHLKTYPI